MMTKYAWRDALRNVLIALMVGLVLASCSGTSSIKQNALQQSANSPYLNKPMQLTNAMLLVEAKPIDPTAYAGYWLFDAPVTTYYNNFIHANLPTLTDFQTNAALWQNWQGTAFSDRARILAVIPAGTAFHIVDISQHSNTQTALVNVQLDASQYKNSRAMYGNPKSIVPNLDVGNK